MEYIFNDWHFVKHFEESGQVYGCLWRGQKPDAWGIENLAQLSRAEFQQFTQV